jgi:hypothetical protein
MNLAVAIRTVHADFETCAPHTSSAVIIILQIPDVSTTTPSYLGMALLAQLRALFIK